MRALIYVTLGLIWNMQVSTETIGRCKGESKPYFIYNSSLDVEVYFCINDVQTPDGCGESGAGATVNDVSLADTCASKLYGSKRCGDVSPSGRHYECLIANLEQKSFIVCMRTVKFNLQENKVIYPLIDEHKYPHAEMFHGKFKNLELIYTSIGTETEINSKKYITSNVNNNIVALELKRKLWFFKEQVWTTNIAEIFVTDKHMEGSIYNRSKIFGFQNEFQKTREFIKSECELDTGTDSQKGTEPSTEQTVQDLPDSSVITKFSSAQDSTALLSQDETIAALRNQLHCAIFVFIICVLWLCITSAFDMYINFLTLRRAARKRTNRSRTYIMNCALQSLTNRCLFLNKNAGRGKLGIPLDVTRDADNHNVYESID